MKICRNNFSTDMAEAKIFTCRILASNDLRSANCASDTSLMSRFSVLMLFFSCGHKNGSRVVYTKKKR
jgi:hypothetical protein